MRFAQSFSSEAFGEHVSQEESGRYRLPLPSEEDDPMLASVRKVREREYLFIDTIDEYYANFHRSVYPTYQVWRKASYVDMITYKKLQTQAKKPHSRRRDRTGWQRGDNLRQRRLGGRYQRHRGRYWRCDGHLRGHTQKNEAEQYAERLRELATETERTCPDDHRT